MLVLLASKIDTVHILQKSDTQTIKKQSQRKIEKNAAQVIAKAEHILQLDEAKSEVMKALDGCFLGYAAWNCYGPTQDEAYPKLVRNDFNKRPEDKMHVNHITDDMNRRGKQAYTAENCIAIGVYPDMLDITKLLSSAANLNSNNVICWTDVAKDKTAVLFNGQHRIAANLQRIQQQQEALESIQNILAQGSTSKTSALKQQAEDLEKLLIGASFWGVKLYNLDAIASSLYKFTIQAELVANATVMKKDTQEQDLIFYLNLIRAQPLETRDAFARQTGANHKNSVILHASQDKILRDALLCMTEYAGFCYAKELTNSLIGSWSGNTGVLGGLMTTVIHNGIEELDFLVQDCTLPSYHDYQQHLQTLPSAKERKAYATEQYHTLRNLLKAQPTSLHRFLIPAQVTHALEEKRTLCLGSWQEMTLTFGAAKGSQQYNTYMEQWKKYRTEVIAIFEEFVSDALQKTDLEEDVTKVLQDMANKVQWLLFTGLIREEGSVAMQTPMPLLTPGLLVAIFNMLQPHEEAFIELADLITGAGHKSQTLYKDKRNSCSCWTGVKLYIIQQGIHHGMSAEKAADAASLAFKKACSCLLMQSLYQSYILIYLQLLVFFLSNRLDHIALMTSKMHLMNLGPLFKKVVPQTDSFYDRLETAIKQLAHNLDPFIKNQPKDNNNQPLPFQRPSLHDLNKAYIYRSTEYSTLELIPGYKTLPSLIEHTLFPYAVEVPQGTKDYARNQAAKTFLHHLYLTQNYRKGLYEWPEMIAFRRKYLKVVQVVLKPIVPDWTSWASNMFAHEPESVVDIVTRHVQLKQSGRRDTFEALKAQKMNFMLKFKQLMSEPGMLTIPVARDEAAQLYPSSVDDEAEEVEEEEESTVWAFPPEILQWIQQGQQLMAETTAAMLADICPQAGDREALEEELLTAQQDPTWYAMEDQHAEHLTSKEILSVPAHIHAEQANKAAEKELKALQANQKTAASIQAGIVAASSSLVIQTHVGEYQKHIHKRKAQPLIIEDEDRPKKRKRLHKKTHKFILLQHAQKLLNLPLAEMLEGPECFDHFAELPAPTTNNPADLFNGDMTEAASQPVAEETVEHSKEQTAEETVEHSEEQTAEDDVTKTPTTVQVSLPPLSPLSAMGVPTGDADQEDIEEFEEDAQAKTSSDPIEPSSNAVGEDVEMENMATGKEPEQEVANKEDGMEVDEYDEYDVSFSAEDLDALP
ncbi:hypothetical protein NM688_g7018 [Phlebia brevispora]|uniref:Uncharacterized protein n=1 Tax=Phlebia brevispora TaxID=194682 RepID=A0ACC1SA25_9APHY|nr:hypothetical protein NM688_g7018 [Phlebia brevispora]